MVWGGRGGGGQEHSVGSTGAEGAMWWFFIFLFFIGEIILNESRLPGLGASGLQLPSCGDNPAEMCVGSLAL